MQLRELPPKSVDRGCPLNQGKLGIGGGQPPGVGTTRGGLWEIWAVDKDARKFASFCSEAKPTFRRKPMFYSTPRHGFFSLVCNTMVEHYYYLSFKFY